MEFMRMREINQEIYCSIESEMSSLFVELVKATLSQPKIAAFIKSDKLIIQYDTCRIYYTRITRKITMIVIQYPPRERAHK